MKRPLVAISCTLAAAFIALLVVLNPEAKEGQALVSPDPIEAEQARALDSAGLAQGESETRVGVPTPGAEGGEPSEEDDKEGNLRIMTETEFLDRLRDLGIDHPAELFDRIHRQRVDMGAVLVLVTDEENDTVSGARVLLDPATPEALRGHIGSGSYSRAARQESTGANGVALFANVEPIPHLLGVEHPDYLTRFFGSVQALAGERTYIEAVLEKPQTRIEGLVVNTDAIAIEGVSVAAFHYTEGGVPFATTGSTGLDGKFSLGVVTGAQNVVTAGKLGYKSVRWEHVAAGTQGLLITLEETKTVNVKGFVTQGASLDPVTEFSVDVNQVFDSRGLFSVERNVSPTPLAMTFSADGFEPRVLSVDLSSGRDVDVGQVSLFGEKELSGIVLLEDEEGQPQPLDGASVSIVSGSGVTGAQVTASDGLFSFRGLEGESTQLSVSAPGASQYQNTITLLEDGPTYVEVVLERGEYRVFGRVIDDETEEPIEGATVEIIERPDHVTLSGPDGAYEITGIPISTFTLKVTKSGYRSLDSPPLAGTEEGTTWDARLEASGLRIRFLLGGQPAPAGIDVMLWKRIEPTVQAAQAAQQNIANLRIDAATDEDGAVTFDVEDGDYFVQAPVYRLHPTLVRADSESSEWRTIPLPGTTSLEGRILNADGTPVANTGLWLHSGDQDYTTMFLYHTDSSGSYSIPNLAARPYALSIIKSVADQSAQHVREFTGSGAPQQTFNVSFPPLSASVSGRLTDENGNGISGVQMGVEYLDAPHRSILAGWVGTDISGNFHIPRLEPGTHILRTAWTDDETVFSDAFTLAAGEHLEVDLTAPNVPGKEIRGHMIAGDGGPLGGTFVFATDSEGHQNGNYFSSMDWGYIGAFTVAGLRADTYQIDLTAMGCVEQTVPVLVAGSVSDLVVTMPREE